MQFAFNPNYCTKKDLYAAVDNVRSEWGLDSGKGNRDFYKKCASFNEINLQVHDLLDRDIHGFAIPDKMGIVLNSLRTDVERNFDSSHEFAHITLHPSLDLESFQCIENGMINVNEYIEWQANEAGAEIIIAYREFIPEFVDAISKCSSSSDYWKVIDYFMDKYNVTRSVVKNRIDGLRYEISQYEKGISINAIEILSFRQQKKNNIFVPSYHDRFNAIKKAPR